MPLPEYLLRMGIWYAKIKLKITLMRFPNDANLTRCRISISVIAIKFELMIPTVSRYGSTE